MPKELIYPEEIAKLVLFFASDQSHDHRTKFGYRRGEHDCNRLGYDEFEAYLVEDGSCLITHSTRCRQSIPMDFRRVFDDITQDWNGDVYLSGMVDLPRDGWKLLIVRHLLYCPISVIIWSTFHISPIVQPGLYLVSNNLSCQYDAR